MQLGQVQQILKDNRKVQQVEELEYFKQFSTS